MEKKLNNKKLIIFYYLLVLPAVAVLFLSGFNLPSVALMVMLLATIRKKHLILAEYYCRSEEVEKSIKHLKATLIFYPFSSEVFNLLGENYALADKWPQAIKYFRLAIRFNPHSAVVYSNLGLACQETGETSLAEDSLLKAIKLDPALTGAYSGLGLIYTELGDFAKALFYLDKGYILRRGEPLAENTELLLIEQKNCYTGLHKLKHDIGQLSFLLEQNKLPPVFGGEIEKYRLLYDFISLNHPGRFLVELDKFPATYDKNIYFEKFKNITGPAVNQDQDIARIQQDYHNTFSGLVWFDNFLTAEALQSLREFCLNSTIWHDYNKTRGYIGSYMDDGFYSPLLFQIAIELKNLLPDIFGLLPLTYMWSYKYHADSKGFKVHADRAAINVNFWLTSDAACLNPESSGMIIYEKLPPPGWNFDDYNMKTSTIRQYLDEENSKSINVPYRQNRVVIFDSRIFHETGDFVFKEGYENMRLNVTFLFGNKPKRY